MTVDIRTSLDNRSALSSLWAALYPDRLTHIPKHLCFAFQLCWMSWDHFLLSDVLKLQGPQGKKKKKEFLYKKSQAERRR